MRGTLSRRLAASSAALSIVVSALLAAASPSPSSTLRSRRPQYGGTLRVEMGAALASLEPTDATGTPEELAARAQIASFIYDTRPAGGAANAPGPFRVSEWQPGKELMLAANEKYSGGRPYLDSIEITMNRAAKDRLLDLELNKTDFAEIAPQDARHAAERGVRVSTSQPDELVALVFPAGAGTREKTSAALREAISASIDRTAIANFILQKTGEPAGGLLPQWSSGTAFLFAPAATAASGTARAKELLGQITAIPKLVLGYDSADPLAQAIAERIAVNAKEAGISMATLAMAPNAGRTAAAAQADIVLTRIRMTSAQPAEALDSILAVAATMTDVESDPLAANATAQDVLDRERAVMKTFRVVPLEWVPQVYGLSARVRDWNAPGPGENWPFADVWLDTAAAVTTQ